MPVLDYFNLLQHTDFPTHVHGHTLDLVCSTGIDIAAIKGSDIGISDHKLIKSLIYYRAWNSVDPLSLFAALSDPPSLPAAVFPVLKTFLISMMKVFFTILNIFYPIKSRHLPFSMGLILHLHIYLRIT